MTGAGTVEAYKNLSKKYRIDRDDFEAQFERLTRYVLETYNFGSELVTLAYLDLIRRGDIPEESGTEKRAGIYRREKGEAKAAQNVIKLPSEIIAEARKAKAGSNQSGSRSESREAIRAAAGEVLPGQTSIFDETKNE